MTDIALTLIALGGDIFVWLVASQYSHQQLKKFEQCRYATIVPDDVPARDVIDQYGGEGVALNVAIGGRLISLCEEPQLQRFGAIAWRSKVVEDAQRLVGPNKWENVKSVVSKSFVMGTTGLKRIFSESTNSPPEFLRIMEPKTMSGFECLYETVANNFIPKYVAMGQRIETNMMSKVLHDVVVRGLHVTEEVVFADTQVTVFGQLHRVGTHLVLTKGKDDFYYIATGSRDQIVDQLRQSYSDATFVQNVAIGVGVVLTGLLVYLYGRRIFYKKDENDRD